MYLPTVYEVTDNEKLCSFIESNNFADLVTYNNGELCSNKVPFFFEKETNLLYGHFGQTNPQLVDIKESGDVLVIFSGPHAYISPRWYESDHMVPTWNFQSVQVRGKASIIDEDSLTDVLRKLSQFQESVNDAPWSMEEVENGKLESMKKMIVGFKIEIVDVKFKEKMSQTRVEGDKQSVINALNGLGNENAIAVAKIMSNNVR